MAENVRGRSSETKFGRVPLWLYDTGVGLQAIATYGWLHGRYGHYERVMPSYGTLAKELGVSRGSVIAYVKALTSVGAVRIQTSGAAGRQTNVYVIAFAEPFQVGGQNTDQGGQDADPVVSGVHHPSQPAGRGGQPVVQEEDVSSKTFLEDEKLSLPDAAPQRAEVATVSDEREIPVSNDQPSTAQRVVRTAGIVTADEEEAFIAWTTAKHQPRSSAWWRTVAGNGDLPDLAADWRAQGGLDATQPLTGTDATVAGWLNLAGQLGGRTGGAQSRPSVTDQRVQAALDLGRRMQAEADARRGGGYRPQSPNDAWNHIRQQADAGERPDGWEKYPHCGHPDCDEVTRMRDTDVGAGQRRPSYCSGCHPVLQWH